VCFPLYGEPLVIWNGLTPDRPSSHSLYAAPVPAATPAPSADPAQSERAACLAILDDLYKRAWHTPDAQEAIEAAIARISERGDGTAAAPAAAPTPSSKSQYKRLVAQGAIEPVEQAGAVDERQEAGMVLVRADVVAFLNGAAALDGQWYGDRPDHGPPFWWREYLPNIAAQSAQPAQEPPK
jgi:hypothetical protein